MIISVPFFKQKNSFYCGPAVLQMIFAYFGTIISQDRLARAMRTTKKRGTLRKQLMRAATYSGLKVRAKHQATIADITRYLRRGVPVVVNYIEPSDDEGHYAIVVGAERSNLMLNDPHNGKGFQIRVEEFRSRWRSEDPREAQFPKWIMAVTSNKESRKKI